MAGRVVEILNHADPRRRARTHVIRILAAQLQVSLGVEGAGLLGTDGYRSA